MRKHSGAFRTLSEPDPNYPVIVVLDVYSQREIVKREKLSLLIVTPLPTNDLGKRSGLGADLRNG